MPQAQRRLRVDAVIQRLQRDLVGGKLGEHLAQVVGEGDQALRQRLAGV
jgi:hypothetical protein